MKKWILKVVVVFATLLTGALGAEGAKAIIVFDASGSMWGGRLVLRLKLLLQKMLLKG